MFCPKCGDPLAERGGLPCCERGDMPLSPRMAQRLEEAFGRDSPEEVTHEAGDATGSQWHCPSCGLEMKESAGRVACPKCGRRLDPFIYELVEFHPHEGWPRRESGLQRLATWWKMRRVRAELRKKWGI